MEVDACVQMTDYTDLIKRLFDAAVSNKTMWAYSNSEVMARGADALTTLQASLAKAQGERDALQAQLAEARDKALDVAIMLVDNEYVPKPGEMPIGLRGEDPEIIAIASVRATKASILTNLRALKATP